VNSQNHESIASNLPPDPLADGGILKFGQKLREGLISSESVTRTYLTRIKALDGRLNAFEHIDFQYAIRAAQEIDNLLSGGVDLGPLMGVPVALKDIIAVEGMPTTAGSKINVQDIVGGEGSIVRSLKAAGCIILGKVKTVEFALGAVGISQPRGTPWNPWDSEIHRIPGGSSGGPAVAVAAGLCGFAVGTDTGGSVRLPAAFCGIYGFKETAGRRSLDGIFPLHRGLDSIGFLTRSAMDAAIIYSTLQNCTLPKSRPLRSLKLGLADDYFFRDHDASISDCMGRFLHVLEKNGVDIVKFPVPEAAERETYFPVVLSASLLSILGRDRFLKNQQLMDPVVARRTAGGLEVRADHYLKVEERRQLSKAKLAERLAEIDGWIMPTANILPVPCAEFDDIDRGMDLAASITQNTQPGNYFDLCGISIPIQPRGNHLPVGLQILAATRSELALLEIALAVEDIIGPIAAPILKNFVSLNN